MGLRIMKSSIAIILSLVAKVATFRREHRKFNRPSAIDSGPNHAWANSKSLTKLSQTCSRATNRKGSVGSFIAILLGVCSPSAIAGFVSAIFVWPSVKFHPWRAFAHIFKKRFKSVPSDTKGYASAAPIFITRARRLRAAPLHIRPASISPRSAGPVSAMKFFHHVENQAAARFCPTRFDLIVSGDDAITAEASPIALGVGLIARFIWRRFAVPFKSSKCESDKGMLLRHIVGSFNGCKWWAFGRNRMLAATFCIFLAVVNSFGANPDFGAFNANQFGTAGNKVVLKSGALLTNPVVASGAIIGNGYGLTNIPVAALTNAGTAAYSNASAFDLSGAASGATNKLNTDLRAALAQTNVTLLQLQTLGVVSSNDSHNLNLSGANILTNAGNVLGGNGAAITGIAIGALPSNVATNALQITLGHAGTVTLDFTAVNSEANFTGCTGAVTFASSGLAAGHTYVLYGLNTNAANITPTFPVSWSTTNWLGGAPSTITAGKRFVLSLSSRGTTDGNVFVGYAETQ
jgi:hypothetical protein